MVVFLEYPPPLYNNSYHASGQLDGCSPCRRCVSIGGGITGGHRRRLAYWRCVLFLASCFAVCGQSTGSAAHLCIWFRPSAGVGMAFPALGLLQDKLPRSWVYAYACGLNARYISLTRLLANSFCTTRGEWSPVATSTFGFSHNIPALVRLCIPCTQRLRTTTQHRADCHPALHRSRPRAARRFIYVYLFLSLSKSGLAS